MQRDINKALAKDTTNKFLDYGYKDIINSIIKIRVEKSNPIFTEENLRH